jgi:hypothetical protein
MGMYPRGMWEGMSTCSRWNAIPGEKIEVGLG